MMLPDTDLSVFYLISYFWIHKSKISYIQILFHFEAFWVPKIPSNISKLDTLS